MAIQTFYDHQYDQGRYEGSGRPQPAGKLREQAPPPAPSMPPAMPAASTMPPMEERGKEEGGPGSGPRPGGRGPSHGEVLAQHGYKDTSDPKWGQIKNYTHPSGHVVVTAPEKGGVVSVSHYGPGGSHIVPQGTKMSAGQLHDHLSSVHGGGDAKEAAEHQMGLLDDEDYGGELATVDDPEDYEDLKQQIKALEEKLARLEERKTKERRGREEEAMRRELEEAASPDFNLWDENIAVSSGQAATDMNMPRTRDKQLVVRGQAKPTDKGTEDQDDFEKEYLSAVEEVVDEFNPHDTDEQGGEQTDIDKAAIKNATGKTVTGKGENLKVESKK